MSVHMNGAGNMGVAYVSTGELCIITVTANAQLRPVHYHVLITIITFIICFILSYYI